jgi:hypothetical protein
MYISVPLHQWNAERFAQNDSNRERKDERFARNNSNGERFERLERSGLDFKICISETLCVFIIIIIYLLIYNHFFVE